MENTKKRGSKVVLIGMILFIVAWVGNLISTISGYVSEFLDMSRYYYDIDFFNILGIIFDFNSLVGMLLPLALIMLIVYAIINYKTGRFQPILAVPCAILLIQQIIWFFVNIDFFVDEIIGFAKDIIGLDIYSFTDFLYDISDVLYFIAYLVFIPTLLFIIILSIARIKGKVMPIISLIPLVFLTLLYLPCVFIDIYSCFTSMTWYVVEYGTACYVALLIRWLVSSFSWLVFHIGLAVFIPAVLHRPKEIPAEGMNEIPAEDAPAEVAEPESEFDQIQKILEKESAAVIDKDEKDLRLFTDFLTANGYTVNFDGGDMVAAKLAEGEDINSSMGRFIANDNGIYSFAELPSGEYDLRQRLACTDKDISRVILSSRFILKAIKEDNEIVRGAEFKNILALLKSYEGKITRTFSKKIPDMQKQYLLEDYFDLIAIHKIMF